MTAIMKIPGVNQKMQSERRLPSTTSEVTVNFNERAHRITSTKKKRRKSLSWAKIKSCDTPEETKSALIKAN